MQLGAPVGISQPVADDDLLHRAIGPGEDIHGLIFEGDARGPGGHGQRGGHDRADALVSGGAAVEQAPQSPRREDGAEAYGDHFRCSGFHFTSTS